MINLDFLHPYPRYGVAAALVEFSGQSLQLGDLQDLKTLAKFAADSIDRALNRYTLFTENKPLDESTTILKFQYLDGKKVDPGQKSGQAAENGYYLAPHIITNDKSSAKTISEARAIRKLLLNATEENLLKPQYKLKRSFAPLTSKINNGKPSMTEPKATLLEAAFTAITTLTEFKPASQVIGSKGVANTTVIPDLPLVEGDANPLIDFVLLFADLQFKIDAESKNNISPFFSTIDPKDRKYRRPPVFRGNYPNAPRDGSLGAISLVASIGSWAKAYEPFRGDNRASYATRVLDLLAEKPLYVVSYNEFRQESFGHHLVDISVSANLPELIRSAQRAKLHGVEKIDNPKFKLYKFFFEHFLQKFSQATFRDFLATRAEYPTELSPLFEQYMAVEHKQLSPELITSARAYGKSLNVAAFRAAEKEEAEDKKDNRKGRSLDEYKGRILIQFESTILSAKTPIALLSQMGTIIGRLTGREIHSDAGLFVETVAGWNTDNLKLAQDLVTVFMRLNSKAYPKPEAEHTEEYENHNNLVDDPRSGSSN